MAIDSSWIDFELPPDDSSLSTGCLPRPDRCGDRFPIFEAAVPMVPRDQWPVLAPHRAIMDYFIGRIHDQGREGSCVGQGATKAFEILWSLTYGLERAVNFSGMSLYKRIGRTASSGANIGDSLEEMAAEGILPLDTSDNRAVYQHVHPEAGFSKSLPSGWETTAKNFRITEWWDIASFDGIVSALLLGWPVVYGRARHCICALRPVFDDGSWLIKYVNSWGNWGDNGCGYDSEGFLKPRLGQFGAFSPRAIVVS